MRQNDDYHYVLKLLKNSTKHTLPAQNDFKNIRSKEDLRILRNIGNREDAYTNLVRSYVYNHDIEFASKARMKNWFFWITMIAFLILIVCAVSAIIICACGAVSGYVGIGVLVAAIVELITTVITLPKIIAKHLFPQDVDESMHKMLTELFKHDNFLRNRLSTNISREINEDLKKKADKEKNFTRKIN